MVLGTIEITETTSKTTITAWWTTWTEVGNRAMYQTDRDAEMAVLKAITQLRKLAEVSPSTQLDFRVIPPLNGERSLLIEVSC